MADYSPLYLPGRVFSSTASATTVGGQALEVTGDGTVGPASAGSTKVVGHAEFDAVSGVRVGVYGRGAIHETVSSGAITAGALVVAGAAGVIAAGSTAGQVIGIALTTAAGNRVTYMEI